METNYKISLQYSQISLIEIFRILSFMDSLKFKVIINKAYWQYLQVPINYIQSILLNFQSIQLAFQSSWVFLSLILHLLRSLRAQCLWIYNHVMLIRSKNGLNFFIPHSLVHHFIIIIKYFRCYYYITFNSYFGY